jgi:hypothetical protein
MKKRMAIGRSTVPPGSLMEQIQLSPNKNQKPRWNLWRTPDNLAGGSNLPGIQKALDEGHLKRPSGQPIQIRLHDQVREPRLWPTPREFMHKDSTTDRGKGNLGEKVGGQLNPTWVEWLMGYPPGWTDLKH